MVVSRFIVASRVEGEVGVVDRRGRRLSTGGVRVVVVEEVEVGRGRSERMGGFRVEVVEAMGVVWWGR